VKRMLKEFYEIANKEISLLIDSDQHPNVIRYFAKEEDEQFIYLALELCPYSLEDWFQYSSAWAKRRTGSQPPSTISVMKQLCQAVYHLHSLNICHRDIKPGNVLLSNIDFSGKVKLSDMGLGKKINQNKVSFDTTISGTRGWCAPEILEHSSKGTRTTMAVDIFSLGCLLYYISTGGEHPFGDYKIREHHISLGKFKLKTPDLIFQHLIKSMIDLDPEKRLIAKEVLFHPFFWSDAKKLLFISDVSDQLGKDKNSILMEKLEARKKEIFVETTWDQLLDQSLVENVLKIRNYDYTKLSDLLRLWRNLKAHYREYPADVQSLLSPLPDGIFHYFSEKFPKLFMTLFLLVRTYWNVEFQEYFESQV